MARTKCGFDDSPQGSGRDLLVALGPALLVDIGFDPQFDPHIPNQVPASAIRDVQALVDTGATESCIDSLLAAHLELPIIDRARVTGAGGAHDVNVHLAQIHVPRLHVTVHGRFFAVHLQAGGQIHKAFLGRTFLQHFTMIYEGRTGSVTIHDEIT